MKTYMGMIDDVLSTGTRKENRTGVDTLSTFGHYYELFWCDDLYEQSGNLSASRGLQHYLPAQGVHPKDRPLWEAGWKGHHLPLLTTKKVSWKNIVVEMLWFLSGDTSIEILKRHGCKFWDAWADEDGQVPSAYGNFWRNFPTHEGDPSCYGFNDQIRWALEELRRNPMSRRVVISAWAPGNAQTSKLPPCHFAMAFNVQLTPKGEQHLCLHLTQRSCDLALGVPYNMASYGLLLLIFSHLLGIKPGIFAHTLLDLHIYTSKPDGSKAEFDHVPNLKEQRSREPRPLPRLVIDPGIKELADIEALMKPEVTTAHILEVFRLEDYNPHPALKFKVAV